MVWQFRNTGCRTGAFNMRYDEQLASSLAAADRPSVVRIYGWSPPALSLGWHQNIEEIDLRKCSEAGIDIVRRPTGGRAILHSEEVTYSVVTVVSQKSVHSVYKRISDALVNGLRSIGAEVALEKSQPHFPSLYRSSSAMACFASAARYEIHISGRKLVGSAQRRYARPDCQEVVLQHGSILLGPDHLRIVDLLNDLDDLQRRKLRTELDEKTIDLTTALKRNVGYDEVAVALKRGFEKEWNVEFSTIETQESDEDFRVEHQTAGEGHEDK